MKKDDTTMLKKEILVEVRTRSRTQIEKRAAEGNYIAIIWKTEDILSGPSWRNKMFHVKNILFTELKEL